MTASNYFYLKNELIEAGYSNEIDWQTTLKPVTDPKVFRNEAIWVILNSGMKEQIARIISNRIRQAIADKKDISTAFGHKGKVAAIKQIIGGYQQMFDDYVAAKDKVEYLQTIPFIGGITKYHLAKNLGHDVVKPDRHLVRIGKMYNMSCDDLCEKISNETGDKVSLVDIVLWRSANLGMI